jgi:hypothetical protein
MRAALGKPKMKEMINDSHFDFMPVRSAPEPELPDNPDRDTPQPAKCHIRIKPALGFSELGRKAWVPLLAR